MMVLRDKLVRLAISLTDNWSRKYIRRILAYRIMVIILLGSCLIFGQERLTTLVSFRPELHGFHGQCSTGINRYGLKELRSRPPGGFSCSPNGGFLNRLKKLFFCVLLPPLVLIFPSTFQRPSTVNESTHRLPLLG
jgi:hypothetical protein